MSEASFPLLSEKTDNTEYGSQAVPSWGDLKGQYEKRWAQQKEKFQTQLKSNFFALTERYASGKQEIFMLCVPERLEKLYLSAFLELFQSQYTPHVGDVERLAGKKVKRLYITLPNTYHD